MMNQAGVFFCKLGKPLFKKATKNINLDTMESIAFDILSKRICF